MYILNVIWCLISFSQIVFGLDTALQMFKDATLR